MDKHASASDLRIYRSHDFNPLFVDAFANVSNDESVIKGDIHLNEKGFTLIEMLVVMLVISILLLITIPNVTKHNQNIQKKGCEGLINMVQAQITAYQMDHDGKTPSLGELESEGYIKKNLACPNGKSIVISNGKAQTQ